MDILTDIKVYCSISISNCKLVQCTRSTFNMIREYFLRTILIMYVHQTDTTSFLLNDTTYAL